MNNIFYGIAGYHRPECKTYHTLLRLGIPKERIFISLNDKRDLRDYKSRYNDAQILFREGFSVAFNRNTILNHFPKGSWVMLLDDDIGSFKKLVNKDTARGIGFQRLLSANELEDILIDAFMKCKEIGAECFGFYSLENDGWMLNTIQRDGLYSLNKLYQGGFCGFIVSDLRYDESYILQDDYELICRIIKSKGITIRRNDAVASKGKMAQNIGGCFELYKQGKQQEYLRKLKEQYPDLITLKKNMKGVILNVKRH